MNDFFNISSKKHETFEMDYVELWSVVVLKQKFMLALAFPHYQSTNILARRREFLLISCIIRFISISE